MNALYDEDGIDGPFERMMAAPIKKAKTRARKPGEMRTTATVYRYVDLLAPRQLRPGEWANFKITTIDEHGRFFGELELEIKLNITGHGEKSTYWENGDSGGVYVDSATFEGNDFELTKEEEAEISQAMAEEHADLMESAREDAADARGDR